MNPNNNTAAAPTFFQDELTIPAEKYSRVVQIFIHFMYTALFITGVYGNTMALIIYTSRRMRSPVNFLFGNLAVTDLLITLLCIYPCYLPILWGYWPFGEVLCYFLPPVIQTATFVGALTLTVLAVDRCYAIIQPLQHRLTNFKVFWVVGALWIFAGFLTAPSAFMTLDKSDPIRPLCLESGWLGKSAKTSYYIMIIFLQYLFPVTVLFTSYSIICVVVWRTPSLVEVGACSFFRRQAQKKTLFMTIAVIVGYTISWLPYTLLHIYMALFSPIPPNSVFAANASNLVLLAHWVASAHSIVNWYLYGILNPKFKSQSKRLWNILCKSRSTTRENIRLQNFD